MSTALEQPAQVTPRVGGQLPAVIDGTTVTLVTLLSDLFVLSADLVTPEFLMLGPATMQVNWLANGKSSTIRIRFEPNAVTSEGSSIGWVGWTGPTGPI
jgi:hypothetical protein